MFFSYLRVSVLVILFLSASSTSYSQEYVPGYVILHGPDTLHGELQYFNTEEKVEDVRLKAKETVVRYTPTQILGFGYRHGKQFKSIRLTAGGLVDQVAFVEEVVRGQTSLLKYGVIYLLEKEDSVYVLEQKIQTVVDQNVNYEMTKKKYIGVLNYLFRDCPSIGGSISKTELKEKSLVSLVMQYNDCRGKNSTYFKNEIVNIAFKPYIIIGVNYSSAKFLAGYAITISERSKNLIDISPVFGFGFELGTPKSLEGVSFNAELSFSKLRLKEDIYNPGLEEYQVNYLKSKLQVGPKYTFGTKKLALFIRSGVGVSMFTNGNALSTRTNLNTSETYSLSGSINNTLQAHWPISFGCQFQLNDNLYLLTEARMDIFGGESNQDIYTKDFIVIWDNTFKCQTFGFTTSLLFN